MTSISSEKKWLENCIENEYIRFYPFDGLADKDLIGHGACSVVLKAKVITSGITVAYKKIDYDSWNDDEFFKDFVNEVCNYA